MFEQLLVALGHKKEFNRESVTLRLLVKWRQKRIVRKLLQHQRTTESLCQLMAKRGLPRTNIALNGYEIVNSHRPLSVFHLCLFRLIVQHDHI